MPLEDLTGGALIPALNENWPLGSDFPDAGDDHIRGIKNVLKNQFPNIGNTPVTLTGAQINQGSIPVGSRMVFFQAAAPTGWTRVAGITDTAALRVVQSSAAGGGNGGADDPILNDKVPSHTHAIQPVTTGGESVGHTHSGATTVEGAHSHTVSGPWSASGAGGITLHSGSVSGSGPSAGVVADSAGSHQHWFNTSGVSNAHTHTTPAAATDANAPAANWVPRYLDVIVCERAAL